MAQTPPDIPYARPGWLSWLCPLLAWATQIIFGVVFRRFLGPFALFGVVIQIALVAGGLYIGLKVLSLGRPFVTPFSWWSAVVGVALSAGIVVLVLVAAVLSVF